MPYQKGFNFFWKYTLDEEGNPVKVAGPPTGNETIGLDELRDRIPLTIELKKLQDTLAGLKNDFSKFNTIKQNY